MRPERRSLESQVEAGIIAGIAASIPTAILLAIGGALSPYGAAAPFYAIVSIVDPGPLQATVAAVEAGNQIDFFQMQLSGGIGLCVLMGIASGLIFMFGLRKVRVEGWPRYLIGALHGIAMMCIFYIVGLRLVTGVLGIDDADIMSLARIVGWPILVLAHVVHGIVLAWVMRTRMVEEKQVFGPPINADGTLRE